MIIRRFGFVDWLMKLSIVGDLLISCVIVFGGASRKEVLNTFLLACWLVIMMTVVFLTLNGSK